MNPPCRSGRTGYLSSQQAIGIILSISLFLFLAGCGATSPPNLSTSSSLSVNPSEVKFGTAQPNSGPFTRSLRVTNVSSLELKVVAARVMPSLAFRVHNWPGTVTLLPGQSFQLLLAFYPKSAGAYAGILTLSFQHPVGGRKRGDGSPVVFTSGSNSIALLGSASSAAKSMSVSISPLSATLQPGQMLQFKAAVTGPGQKAVKWSAALGSITSSGLYTAPATAVTVADTVTATSVADNNAYAVSAVNVVPAGASGVMVSISPGSTTLQAGQSRQFSASVSGTSNTAVSWSANLGTINSSGMYTAPQLVSQVSDTVFAVSSADPSKYDSAAVLVQGNGGNGGGGPYSITQQESITDVPYPDGLASKPLPADVLSHLLPNSASIIRNTMNNGVTGAIDPSSWGLSWAATPGVNDYHHPVYYATAADPVYVVNACTWAPKDPANNPIGKSFHFPNGAQFGGNPNGASYSGKVDQGIVIWDQTQNVLFSAYTNGSQSPNLPACNDGGPCSVSFSYCEMDDRANDSGYGNFPGAWASNGMSTEGGIIRTQELLQGQVNHALYLDTLCTNGTVVFPNTVSWSTALTCDKVGLSNSNRPPNGALVFLDYTPSQLAYLQTVLPKWQFPVIAAMSLYGGYIGDTTGYANTNILPGRVETGQAYQYYGVTDPLWSFLDKNCGAGCSVSHPTNSPPKSATIYTLRFFANIPNLPGPVCSSGTSCSVMEHMHIADPCVAKGLAGLSASEGACF